MLETLPSHVWEYLEPKCGVVGEVAATKFNQQAASSSLVEGLLELRLFGNRKLFVIDVNDLLRTALHDVDESCTVLSQSLVKLCDHSKNSNGVRADATRG